MLTTLWALFQALAMDYLRHHTRVFGIFPGNWGGTMCTSEMSLLWREHLCLCLPCGPARGSKGVSLQRWWWLEAFTNAWNTQALPGRWGHYYY